MPQLQILPQVPGFGEQIGQALGSGLSQGISERIQQHLESKQNKSTLEGLRPFFKQLDLPDESINEMIERNIPVQLATNLATTVSSQRAAQQKLEQQYKMHREKLESKEIKKGDEQSALQNTFDTMSNMVAKNAPGIGISPGTAIGYSREGVQNRQMFTSMRAGIEAALVPKVNKGALARERFNYIMSVIPNASDSQRTIVGKLAGLAKALSEEGMEIDTSILKSIPWAKETIEQFEPKKSKQPKEEKFEVGQSVESLPDPTKYKGGVFSKGNRRFRSDGKTWREIK